MPSSPFPAFQSEVYVAYEREARQALNYMQEGRPKWIILPVALPGAGSTELVVALERVFGFTRVKLPVSATIASQERAPVEARSIEAFQSQVAEELERHHVVLADSNNHLARHREIFRSITACTTPRAQLLAFNWELPPSSAAVHSICHNSVKGSTSLSAEDIWRYIRAREILQPDEVDVSIDLRLEEDARTRFARAVDAIVQALQLERPDPRSIQEATRLLYDRQSTSFLRQFPSGPQRSLATGREHHKLASLLHYASIMGQTSNPVIGYRKFTTPEGVAVTCWKAQKTAYYKLPNELPFVARGFWTRRIVSRPKTQNYAPQVHHEIVVRGYDKFFAIDEMPWVTWNAITRYTQPPYHVTAKRDGSLIMVSSVTRGQLLVTSKHSFGPQNHRRRTHAQIGEQWLAKQLEKVKRSPSELALLLRERNWTLMCELLDDSFEEHVIAVPVEKAGLHLHGINSRTMMFKTEDPAAVQAFAKDWGFFPTPFVTLPSVSDVIKLANSCYEGRWNGEYLPGLVIRTRVKDNLADDSDGSRRLPYPPPCEEGSAFFFTTRFSHPFTLWHGYREITQFAIKGHATSNQRFPSSNLKKEWVAYASWVARQIGSDSALRDELAQGRGYIALRERFMSWTASTGEGQHAVTRALNSMNGAKLHGATHIRPSYYDPKYKWLILLVGLPGCGKTVLSRALARLYGFKHIELGTCGSRKAQKAKVVFDEAVHTGFYAHDVVIADAHSHRAERREKIRSASVRKRPKAVDLVPKTFALEWQTPPGGISASERICSLRLAARDALVDMGACERQVRRFCAEYEALQDGEVDSVIPIKYSDHPLDTLNRVVAGISKIMGFRPPSAHMIEQAASVMSERTLTGALGSQVGYELSDHLRTRHFTFLPELDIRALLEGAAAQLSTQPSHAAFWSDALPKDDRICNCPRVTIIHPRTNDLLPADAEELSRRCAAFPPSALVGLCFAEIIYNHRIAIAPVRAIVTPDQNNGEVARFINQLPPIVLSQLHVVLARRSCLVAPQEGVALLQSLRGGISPAGISSLALAEVISAPARVRGFTSH